jgi:signal peptidase I
MLASVVVYATFLGTFGLQVTRVDGLSMAPTLEDHDRLIVNKLVYQLESPQPGDIVIPLPAQSRAVVREARHREGRRNGPDC